MSDPIVTYNDIFASNLVTGIRQDVGAVVITGFCPSGSDGKPQALLYRGPLVPTDSTGFAYLTPSFPGQTVTTAMFYGPTTALFDPEIGAGNIRAVGSYNYTDGGKGAHSMMYQGSLDGSGAWSEINVPEAVAGGTVATTIAHSTMGDLVVGNYDLAGQPGSANAFIYNIKTKIYSVLDIGSLTSAYGIWRNGDNPSTSYTIAGGYKSGHGLNKGFLLNYDPATGRVTDLTNFSYNNDPGIITHFEGITGVAGGYTMAAATDVGAAFAMIPRNADGSFGVAKWLPIANPASVGLCTGNSILENNLIGIYQTSGGGNQSYVATVTAGL